MEKGESRFDRDNPAGVAAARWTLGASLAGRGRLRRYSRSM